MPRLTPTQLTADPRPRVWDGEEQDYRELVKFKAYTVLVRSALQQSQ